jgi:hypothetical protein
MYTKVRKQANKDERVNLGRNIGRDGTNIRVKET